MNCLDVGERSRVSDVLEYFAELSNVRLLFGHSVPFVSRSESRRRNDDELPLLLIGSINRLALVSTTDRLSEMFVSAEEKKNETQRKSVVEENSSSRKISFNVIWRRK